MACVSRNIRTAVPAAYGIPVQRSISERDGSYPEVELGLTGPTSISTNIRTTCSKSLAVFVSNDSSLSVLRSGLLTFFSSLVIQESLINFAGERLRSRMTSHCELILSFCLSASYPRHSNSKKQKRRPLRQIAARLQAVLCVICLQ